MRALLDRVVGLDRRRVDALFAAAIVVELELETWIDRGIPDSHRLLTAVAAALLAAPIAVRRRWPAGALVFSSTVAGTQELLGGQLSATNGISVLLTLAVLAYSAGAWLDLRRGLAALVLAAGAFSVFVFRSESVSSGGIGTELFVLGLVFVAPWFIGRMARERSRRVAAFRRLAKQAAAEHDERERAAITQERVRIGAELQDVIAHSVTAMAIQAAGARRLLRTHPEQARGSILTVEQAGRETLADLRRLLGMLRKDDDPRALAPQPGLDQLGALVDSIRDAGLDCELQREGEPIDLTPGVDLVGYRVIEAVLTCAARNGSSRAAVTIRYRSDRLELEARGDGMAIDPDEELHAMSERVALYDGSLHALPAGITGFALQAQLPLGGAVPA